MSFAENRLNLMNKLFTILVLNGTLLAQIPGQAKPLLDLRDFPGANAGARIQAAHDSASCPSTGCIIDATGLGAPDVIAGLTITIRTRYSQLGTLLIHRNLDDLLLDSVGNQLRLVVDVELAHQVELVCLDGLHTQAQSHGDLFY